MPTATQTASPAAELEAEAKDKVMTEPTTVQTHKRPKSRHRASVACASCRDRRIRCVVPQGESECTQCKRSGAQCIIKNDDERRRAYMCSLTERVNMLESMLKDKGEELPPANHPPMTRHGPRPDDLSPSRTDENQSSLLRPSGSSNPDNSQSSPGSQQGEMLFESEILDHEGSSSHRGEDGDSSQSAASPSMLPPKKDGMISRLLSTRGHLSFDQLSGRLRYFGPTTNCHVHSEFGNHSGESRESLDQARRAEKAMRFLSMESYEYLMDLFWQHYNSYLHVLHQEAFIEDRENGRTQNYSPFLHICVLAMGFRFADRSRPDMQRITVSGRESTLHREAKYMLDYELERPGGIPSVVALLLLGDMECAVGRDNLGWLYAGMAVRIAFDIGLHLDTCVSGMPQREVDIRRMTLWACVIYDKYWALFLGRPTSMKSSDLEVYHLSKQFERLGTCKPAGLGKALETQIYEALLDLMELAGKITENMEPRMQLDLAIDRDAYLRMAALDREFGSWYSRLPAPLKWTPHNINTAPFSFFLLHQQYHAALILLHRPFAMYEEPGGGDEDNNAPGNHFSALSRTVCTKHAIRVAKIFWHHRQRFDTRQIPVTGLQHAGTAATALVAALAFLKDGNDRNNNMQYLECLSVSLQDMSYTYQPAERMHIVLQAVVAELRGMPVDSGNGYSRTVPARRGSVSMEGVEIPSFTKRRNIARLGSQRSQSQRPTSMNLDLNIDPMLSLVSLRKLSDNDSERPDSFMLATPRSEGMSSWRGIPDASGMESTTAVSTNGLPHLTDSGSTWMGTELDAHDISHLASVHFPELRDMPSIGEDGDANNGSTLDFLSFTAPGDEWKEWRPGESNGLNGQDMDRLTSSSVFANGLSGTPGRFENRMAAFVEGM